MKNTVLLISANTYKDPYPVFPIGLSYIMAYLQEKKPEIQVKLMDLNLNPLEEIENFIKDFNPSYIGISFRNIDNQDSHIKFDFVSDYIKLVQLIRASSKSKIIIGGAAFSVYAEDLFNLLKPDFGITGEGEESLYQLINCLENSRDYRQIPGLVYEENQIITVNPRSQFLKNLKPDFNNDLIDYYWNESGILNIQTKRGCPYDCIYCTYPLIEGTKVRNLNADFIVETLQRLKIEKKINYVFFTDSVFNINNDFNVELAEKIINSKINIRWGAYFSPHNLDKELLSLFKKSGLKHIEFGTESISNTQLANYSKHFKVEDIFNISDLCNELGIYYAHFLILGGYGETNETLKETFENSKKIVNAVFFPYIGMRIYPRTKLQEYAIRDGIISKDDNLIKPQYYISKNVDLSKMKEMAKSTGKNWIFPDDDMSEINEMMRIKNKKGLTWHLIR
ncbi:MAG: radical SAM protein [Bacteroidetes bacterium]|nr:radical SAM protein [Bacteroidota bacterium]